MSNLPINVKIEIDDHSPEVLEAFQNAIDRAMEAIGMSAVNHAVDYITEKKAVDTGRLRNSIVYTTDTMNGSAGGNEQPGAKASADDMAPRGKPAENTVIIGTNVEYAPYVELGTSGRMASRPYLRPAAENHAEEYKRIVKESLENA